MRDAWVDITFWITNGMNGRCIRKNGKRMEELFLTKSTHLIAI